MSFNMVPRKAAEEQISKYVSGFSERSRPKILSNPEFIFGTKIFELIDPTPFKVIYDDGCAPCFPVNILIAAEIYRWMYGFSDAQLIRSSLSDRAVRRVKVYHSV